MSQTPLPSPNDRTVVKPERHKRPKPSGLPIIACLIGE